MSFDTKRFLFNDKSKLKDFPTSIEPLYSDSGDYKEQLAEMRNTLRKRQSLLYAGRERGALVIFQGMDTAGKDGVIKHVMSGLNPLGVEVTEFSRPSSEEKHRDFLWRTHLHTPPRGKIGIFNRSYYEEVLTVRVHPASLAEENLPEELTSDKKFWQHRFADINHHERYLHRQGYSILKVFLHLSKEEQKRRLLARIDDSAKNWKFDPEDLKDRELWPDFMKAYDECLAETSTTECPWYVVPADDKKNARFIVSRILQKTLGDVDLSEPKVTAEQRKNLKKLRKSL